MNKIFIRRYTLSLCLVTLVGCSPLITKYDQYSYTQNSSIKVEVLNMIDKSATDYSGHEKDIADLLMKVEKAREYDIHKPQNDVMAKMWDVLWKRLQSDKKRLVIRDSVRIGFFPFWKDKKTVTPTFSSEARIQISDMFDTILDLESAKIKESDVDVNKFSSLLK